MEAEGPLSVSVEPLYVSEHLRVTHFPRESDFVVVTFDHWEAGKRTFKDFTAGSLWAKRGYSQLHVGAARNHWFLAPDTLHMLTALREACCGYASITTYGSSMAGYAALLFGGALRAQRALAISPHFSVDPAKVPFETRWSADRQGLDFSADRLGALGGDVQDAVIVYDPLQPADTAHVRMLQQHFPAWQYVALRHGGHPAFQTLASAGRSALATGELLDNTAPGPALVRLHKAARGHSPTYWAMLAERNLHRPSVFLPATQRCLTLRGTPGDALFRLSRSLIDRRHPMLAALLMHAAIERTPEAPRWWHTTYASALERVQLLHQKVLAVRQRSTAAVPPTDGAPDTQSGTTTGAAEGGPASTRADAVRAGPGRSGQPGKADRRGQAGKVGQAGKGRVRAR